MKPIIGIIICETKLRFITSKLGKIKYIFKDKEKYSIFTPENLYK